MNTNNNYIYQKTVSVEPIFKSNKEISLHHTTFKNEPQSDNKIVSEQYAYNNFKLSSDIFNDNIQTLTIKINGYEFEVISGDKLKILRDAYSLTDSTIVPFTFLQFYSHIMLKPKSSFDIIIKFINEVDMNLLENFVIRIDEYCKK